MLVLPFSSSLMDALARAPFAFFGRVAGKFSLLHCQFSTICRINISYLLLIAPGVVFVPGMCDVIGAVESRCRRRRPCLRLRQGLHDCMSFVSTRIGCRAAATTQRAAAKRRFWHPCSVGGSRNVIQYPILLLAALNQTPLLELKQRFEMKILRTKKSATSRYAWLSTLSASSLGRLHMKDFNGHCG